MGQNITSRNLYINNHKVRLLTTLTLHSPPVLSKEIEIRMSPSTFFSFLFTLSLIIISSYAAPPPHAAPPPQKKYEVVCRGDAHCLKVLGSDPRIVAATEWVPLCSYILEMGANYGVKAQTYVKGLYSKYPSSEALKLCVNEDYTYSINSFRSSMGELIEDPMTANYDAKVAGDGPGMCKLNLDDEKLTLKLVIPAINAFNDGIKFFSNVAFEATNYLY